MTDREMELKLKKNRTDKETQELLALIRKDTAKVREQIKILEKS